MDNKGEIYNGITSIKEDNSQWNESVENPESYSLKEQLNKLSLGAKKEEIYNEITSINNTMYRDMRV